MRHKRDSNFVWADLSTYSTTKASSFYTQVFDWNIYDQGKAKALKDDRFDMEEVSYHFASIDKDTIAGIFDMPHFFQKIKMPSFWMSYLSVDNIIEVVNKARSFEGSVIDIEPTPFGQGTMALIRDPLGAGFTVYEGPSIDSKGDGSKLGKMVWNELFTESIEKVSEFYTQVFGFKLVADNNFVGRRAKVYNLNDQEIAGIQEVKESIRTNKVYWIPFFSVNSIEDFIKTVEKANGEFIANLSNSDSFNNAIMYDDQGAAFGVSEISPQYSKKAGNSPTGQSNQSSFKWKSILAILLIWLAVFVDFQWVWGVLFIIWVYPDIKKGNTYFVEYLDREVNPVEYWIIVLSWILMSVYLILL